MRFYYLQLSRFIAALYVVFYHKLVTGIPALDFIISRGDSAVSFFFILSGFVVANSLLRKPMVLGEYLARRSLKILPQWYLSIALSLVLAGITITPFRFFLSSILLQAAYPEFALDVNFVGWSLSVEVIMYLVLFWIVRSFNVWGVGFLATSFAVYLISQGAFLWLLQRGMELVDNGFNMRFFMFYHPVWHLGSFLFGICCAAHIDKIQLHYLTRLRYPALLLTVAYLLILLVVYYTGYKWGVDRFYHNGFFAPLTGLYLLLLVRTEDAGRGADNSLRNRLFDALGGISFGIYLFHIPVYGLLNRYYPIGNGGLSFWVYIGFLMIFCYVSYLILDQRLHRYATPMISHRWRR